MTGGDDTTKAMNNVPVQKGSLIRYKPTPTATQTARLLTTGVRTVMLTWCLLQDSRLVSLGRPPSPACPPPPKPAACPRGVRSSAWRSSASGRPPRRPRRLPEATFQNPETASLPESPAVDRTSDSGPPQRVWPTQMIEQFCREQPSRSSGGRLSTPSA